MSTEINTRGMVRSKAPDFPDGNDNECLSKSEITATGKALVNGNYGDNECPVIDDVLPNVVTWEYTFSVSSSSLSFNADGGTEEVVVESYKRKFLNGSYTGEQIDVRFSSSASGAGFGSSGTLVTASVNMSTSSLSGVVVFFQEETEKTATVNISQYSYYGTYRGNRMVYNNGDTVENTTETTEVSYEGGESTIMLLNVPISNGGMSTIFIMIKVTIERVNIKLNSVDFGNLLDCVVTGFYGKIDGRTFMIQLDFDCFSNNIRLIFGGTK